MTRYYLKIVVAAAMAMLFTGVFIRASEAADVWHVSGEVTWIDLKLGKLQLKSDTSAGTGEISEYRVTEHETRVKSPLDKKFLSVKDLQPGQHVTFEVVDEASNKIVQEIVIDPRVASDFQEAYGTIQAIDGQQGTLVLTERTSTGEMLNGNLAYFVFEPRSIVAMHSPSKKPVELLMKPGDVVKVEYVVNDGKQWARSITMYSLKVTSTTTTTTTTTSQ